MDNERNGMAGVVRNKVVCAVSDLKSLLFLPMYSSLGAALDHYQLENDDLN